MVLSQAAVTTQNGESYIKRLGKHWSHRFPVEQSDGVCSIDFGEGQIIRLRSEEGTLQVAIWDETGSRLDRLEEVVQAHLERFAAKETLEFHWIHQDQGVLS